MILLDSNYHGILHFPKMVALSDMQLTLLKIILTILNNWHHVDSKRCLVISPCNLSSASSCRGIFWTLYALFLMPWTVDAAPGGFQRARAVNDPLPPVLSKNCFTWFLCSFSLPVLLIDAIKDAIWAGLTPGNIDRTE